MYEAYEDENKSPSIYAYQLLLFPFSNICYYILKNLIYIFIKVKKKIYLYDNHFKSNRQLDMSGCDVLIV